jgi:hypothetical protein
MQLFIVTVLAVLTSLVSADEPGGGPDPAPPTYQLVKGVSIGGVGVASESEYRKALKQGYVRAAIRGYTEYWENQPGGGIDSTFYQNLVNAWSAGVELLDVTWFPCSGPNNQCRSYQDQAQTLVKYIQTNQLPIQRIFLDIEKDLDSGNWDYGHDQNLLEARNMANALKEAAGNVSGIGIYSTPGMWEQIFGSRDKVVDNGISLWYGTWDGNDSFDSLYLNPKFGGWEIAVAKQYDNSTSSLSEKFQVNIILQTAD